MIYTTHKLFEALRGSIPNLPSHATEITIRLRAGHEPPIVEAKFYAQIDGSAGGPEADHPTESGRFYLVTEENWNRWRQFVAWSEDDLVRLS